MKWSEHKIRDSRLVGSISVLVIRYFFTKIIVLIKFICSFYDVFSIREQFEYTILLKLKNLHGLVPVRRIST